MESQRSFLLIGLALVSYLLWEQWQVDHAPKPAPTPAQIQQTAAGVSPTAGLNNGDVPVSSNELVAATSPANSSIEVTTDVLKTKINLLGGDVIDLKLLDYAKEKDSEEPYTLLSESGAQLFHAQSGLTGTDGPDASSSGRPLYKAAQTNYTMTGDTLSVPLTYLSPNGLTVTKTFVFTKGEHIVKINFDIQNNSNTVKNVQLFAQLKQHSAQAKSSMMMPTYHGAAYSTNEEKYEKASFDDIFDKNINMHSTGGWIAMIEHYFVTAFIPAADEQIDISTKSLSGGLALITYKDAAKSIAPGQSISLSTTLYSGPKDQDKLAELAESLELTVDYGMLWFISQPLFHLLQFLHGLVANWGVAIILITIIVKGCMYTLTKKQYTSMAKLRQLQPKLTELKSRYGDDRQKFSQAMMELYRKEKVNPMGGCLPILIQMPIFLALYWVFVESVELRHAEFALWIHDLSQQDPYYVLPILMGVSMFIMQKLQPTPVQDPVQQKIFQYMPVAFTFFFLWFPSGLVLYWLVSNVISIIQMLMINKSIQKQGLGAK
ncbi:membrane protein insertase YidC [Catenovulum sp. 2E275]|uniref:membrane protein insertase YidC n=1 Tax=Catenovulum sp. 2E275 TaxID=2980497 RepID=UPI0021CF8E95|nr:membrane protein insertase YidC [Catenovulum sp. 2E275]MCU4675809.1 membrane protein insertase YidC [Catenovulum sp. 2E275]